MNTRLNFRGILAVAVALLVSGAAGAQPDNPGPGRPPASQGRQIIIQKLESLRLSTVMYDGLPLAEVVNSLRDETIKRDPDKKGINFILNPNTPIPATQPGDAPAEAVDITSVAVRIRPALNDVRMADVLDAIIKVADHPLQYSVEDYGVVFSLAGTAPARADESAFAFPGGTPHEFLEAVQKQFRVDWLSVADIPREMADVHIPKLRINRGSLAPASSRGVIEAEALGALVTVYHEVSAQKPELGRLLVHGDLTRPSVVMFVPDKATLDLQPKLLVRAFSVAGIDADSLQADILRAKDEATKYSEIRGLAGLRNLDGRVAFHKETRLLVATGPDSFVDMVESIVAARQRADEARTSTNAFAAPKQ